MPRGMIQKSAMHAGGVGRFVRSSDDILKVGVGLLWMCMLSRVGC